MTLFWNLDGMLELKTGEPVGTLLPTAFISKPRQCSERTPAVTTSSENGRQVGSSV